MSSPPNPAGPYQPQLSDVPPPAVKKRKLTRNLLLVFGIPVVLFVLIGIIAVATRSGRQGMKGGFQAGLGSSGGAPTTARQAQAAQTTTMPQTPPPPPKKYTGKGDDVVQVDVHDLGVVIFECPGCTGSVVLKSDGDDVVLVNAIGAYTGKHWINYRGGTTSELTVKAAGAWTITVGGLDLATLSDGTAPVTGKGDDVVVFRGGFRVAAISNTGSKDNFIVKVKSAPGSGLPQVAVNVIGSYEGTVHLAAPGVVQVTSSGNWTITPRG